MKKSLSSILTAAAVSAAALSAVPFSVSAEDAMVYGTMNIPYADFYAAEFGTASNAYEVDAVSSATTTKWAKTGEGELFEGAYASAPNEDGSGTILGVNYAVAITQADLDALGADNYGFAPLDAQPAAYKTVTVADGKASFGAVEAERKAATADVSLSTETPWGDYLLKLENAAPEFSDKYRGVIIKTADGNAYAMRHEQNIWRGQVAWSSGIKTSEPHGNVLDFEDYQSLMGATITEIDIINTDAVYVVAADTYVPVKFAGSATVADSASGTGTAALTTEGFPADYQKQYNIGEGFTVTDDTVSYTDAAPGSYTLTISDASGKYADVLTTFTLSTADLPAAYNDGKIVKAENASDADFQNFLKNIASVEVNGAKYSAAGKGSVKIIGEDGAIDFAAAGRDGNVFDGSGNYTMSVTATGYTNPLNFTIEPAATTVATTTTTTSKTTTTTTKAKSGSSTTTAASTASPKTGDATSALPLAGAFIAAGTAAIAALRKKNK